MQKKTNGKTHVPKYFDVKLEMPHVNAHYEAVRSAMETYLNWIMSGFIRAVLYETSPQWSQLVTLIELDNHRTKDIDMWIHPLQLVDTQPAPEPVQDPTPRRNTMYDDFDDDETENKNFAKMHEDTRQWFLSELENSRDNLIQEARDEYIGGDCPNTLKEAVEKIQKGDFAIKEGYDTDLTGSHAIPYALRWTSKPADLVSFDKARKMIHDAYRIAYRRIMASVSYTSDLPLWLDKFERTKWKDVKPLIPLPATNLEPALSNDF